MKRLASKTLSSSDEREPLDAGNDIERTQGLELKRQRVQDQGNDGERSIQAVSGVSLLPTQAGLRLECSSFQDISRGAIQASKGFAGQPTQAGLGLGHHYFQEQPNVEELAIQASGGAAIQLQQAASRLESHDFEGQPNVEKGSVHGAFWQPMQVDSGLKPQEQPDVEERGGVGLQSTQALPGPLIRVNDTLESLEEEFCACSGKSLQSSVRTWATHPEEETGSKVGSLLWTFASDMSDPWNGQGENPLQGMEEEGGRSKRSGLQDPPVDMDDLRFDVWIELVDLDFGNLRIDDDEEDSGIQVHAGQQETQDGCPQQGTAGRRMLLQVPLCGAERLSESKCVSIASKQEFEFHPSEPADSRSGDVTKEEGDMIGHLRAEGLIACGSKSEVSQQASQAVSASCRLALTIICLFRSFCRLTRMTFTSLLQTKTGDCQFG